MVISYYDLIKVEGFSLLCICTYNYISNLFVLLYRYLSTYIASRVCMAAWKTIVHAHWIGGIDKFFHANDILNLNVPNNAPSDDTLQP